MVPLWFLGSDWASRRVHIKAIGPMGTRSCIHFIFPKSGEDGCISIFHYQSLLNPFPVSSLSLQNCNQSSLAFHTKLSNINPKIIT